MFIGHIAVGLAAKRVAPKASLGTLLMAAQFTDLLWPVFLLLGVERVAIEPGNTAVCPLVFVSYPISHSLLADVGWAALFAGLYRILKHDSKGAFWTGLVVLSHWVLDVISHRPDMPLYPGSGVRVGLGLWYSLPATLVVEIAMFAAGLILYLKTTRARDKAGVYAFWSLMAVLFIAYLMNLLGPPPPSVRALAVGALLAWVFVPWAYWADRHREVGRGLTGPAQELTPGAQ